MYCIFLLFCLQHGGTPEKGMGWHESGPGQDNCCISRGVGNRHAIIRSHGRCQRPSTFTSSRPSNRIAAGPFIGLQSFNFQLALNQIVGPANHPRLFSMLASVSNLILNLSGRWNRNRNRSPRFVDNYVDVI